MSVTVGKGRSAITIDGPIAEDLTDELNRLLGPVLVALQAKADHILAEDIGEKWPVKSGKTKRAWTTRLRVQPDSSLVEVILVNPLKYTRYIKSTKVGTTKDATRIRSPLVTNVRKPARAALKELKVELPVLLAQAIEREVLDG